MNNKVLFSIIAIVAILIVGAVVLMQNKETSEQASNDTAKTESTESMTNDTATNVNESTDTSVDGTFSGETDVTDNGVAMHEITFNGTAFSPNNLTIKNGDVVRFKNNSDGDFWPASGPHPQHTNYPEFDPKKAIAAGASWEFKFTQTGTWGFHDHLHPTAFGKIIVE